MASLAKFGASCDDLLDSVVVLLDRLIIHTLYGECVRLFVLDAYWIMIMK